MSGPSTSTRRDINNNKFNDHTKIHQGDVHNNVYYHAPHPTARTEIVRIIPYPSNEDLVHRDHIDKLDELLPSTPGSRSAALWGLGGSGKTQIAIDYAYRRCDTDKECCIFWVHAGSEATFLADYKKIGKKLGVDDQLNGTDLLSAVRSAIEAKSKWLMVIDNADNLKLFGVGRSTTTAGGDEDRDQNLHEYIPCAPQGTVLWTSRDGHIAGTRVGARRAIEVQSMAMREAKDLLAMMRNIPLTEAGTSEETGVDALLEELQCLPLAISQAGAYMRRFSMTATEYLGHLMQGKTRWEVLNVSDTDRHRRPEVSNSVLETWRISTEQIRSESAMSYRILHVIAYVENQDIPHELLAAAACPFGVNKEDHQGDEDDTFSTRQIPELEVLDAVTRLKEFSFLSLLRSNDGERRYEMHKLVQEAIRYSLRINSLDERMTDESINRPRDVEALYSGRALQIVYDLFPSSTGPTSWAQCEGYVTHALQVGEWAEVSGTEVKTANLLDEVGQFFFQRGRWREIEPVRKRVLSLRRKVLGEKHPDVLTAMASLAIPYVVQGLYNKAENISQKVLELRREVCGNKHPDTISSMEQVADTKYRQCQYDKAMKLQETVLQLRCEVLGGKHQDTIRVMMSLASTYLQLGRQKKAQEIIVKAPELAKEVLGEKAPLTIQSMTLLAAIYSHQGVFNKAKEIGQQALELHQEVLGEKHPDTIQIMTSLGNTCRLLGQHEESEEILLRALEFGREVCGESHWITNNTITALAGTYYDQGRYNESEQFCCTALNFQRQTLGERHPQTISTMKNLALTQKALQQPTSPTEPILSLAVIQVTEWKEGLGSLWESMRRKVGELGISWKEILIHLCFWVGVCIYSHWAS